ncbi:MAG: pyridoxal phosphate-dependent decarboxylase family protein [Pararhodobacter sp.]
MTRHPFPAGGTAWPELESHMRAVSEQDADWRGGRVPLFVFKNDAETYEIGRKAYFAFFSENALGRKRAFHGIGQMEEEVLGYGLDLFGAPEGAAGAFSSGGSESIFMAMKAARDAWRAAHAGRTSSGAADTGARALNIVMPITAHPAFDKAADAMDLEIRRAPLTADRRGDVAAMAAMTDARTIAIIGSAPCFPHGVIDPIQALSDLAVERGLWLHVDACVGGWMAPFFARIGRGTPAFDFRFPGVRSLSADLHKFGFCPKPASTVFYRDAADLERATFRADAWPSGAFATPTLMGTRPGGAVAAAWAVLNHLGTSGYEEAARRLGAMTDAYVAGLRAIDGITLWATPDLTIINYGSESLDIYAVAKQLQARGWVPGLTRDPKGIHAMLSMLHEPARADYLADLARAVAQVRAEGAGESGLSAQY